MTHVAARSPSRLRQAGTVARTLMTLGVGAIVAACSDASGDGAPPADGRSPVTVAAPLMRDVPVVRSFPGHVEAIERVELRPRVSGYIDSIEFAEGDFVRKGAVLFRIDARRYAAAVSEAEAALARAQAEHGLAQSERARVERLLARQAASREEAERLAAEELVASASIKAAEAALIRARLDLEHANVRAPISGRIGRAEVTAGNLVDADDRLAVLVSSGELYVYFDVDEKALAGTDPQDWVARFSLPEVPGKIYEGPLAFLDNQVIAGTGTIRARLRIAKPDPTLVPGRYGHVELVLGEREDALLVDEKALGADQGARYLLVVGPDGKLEYRPVSIGPRVGPYRVVERGIGADERIVVTGLARVRPGMPVEPREISMAAAAGDAATDGRRIATAGGEL